MLDKSQKNKKILKLIYKKQKIMMSSRIMTINKLMMSRLQMIKMSSKSNKRLRIQLKIPKSSMINKIQTSKMDLTNNNKIKLSKKIKIKLSKMK